MSLCECSYYNEYNSVYVIILPISPTVINESDSQNMDQAQNKNNESES